MEEEFFTSIMPKFLKRMRPEFMFIFEILFAESTCNHVIIFFLVLKSFLKAFPRQLQSTNYT